MFLALLAAFQVAYYEFIVSSAAFKTYLAISGRLAAALLSLVGEKVTASGDMLVSTFSLSIKQGCDGLQAMAIVVIGVLAFPSSARKKIPGVVIGIALLLVLNTLRIATLFWAGVHMPSVFQSLHVHVWPAFLVLSALVSWALWAMWATVQRTT